MKGYKGFDKNMQCKGMQYEVGKEFSVDGKLKLCENGLHFCEYPLDVFGYYKPATSKFAKVEATGEVNDEDSIKDFDNDTKVCTSKLKVCAEIEIPDIVNAAVEYIKDNIDTNKEQETMDAEDKDACSRSVTANTSDNSKATNTGYCSVATNTGDSSMATNIGYRSIAINTGYRGAAINTGDSSIAANTGNKSVATNTDDHSAATNTGDCSAATNMGYKSAATNTGDSGVAANAGNSSVANNTGYKSVATNIGDKSVATNTGDRSVANNTGNSSATINTGCRSTATNAGDKSVAANTGNSSVASNTGNISVANNTGNNGAAIVTGKNSIAVSIGCNGIAKGSLGSWIVLAEWVCNSKVGGCIVKDVQCFKVDGKNILPDTFYRIKDGKLVIVEEVDEGIKALIEGKPEEE